MQSVILAIVIPVLQQLFQALTPAIRELLTNYLRDLLSKSLATVSPWDDFAVRVLCGIAGVDTTGVVAAPPAPGVTPMTMPLTLSKAIVGANFQVVTTTTAGGATVPVDPMLLPGMQGQ